MIKQGIQAASLVAFVAASSQVGCDGERNVAGPDENQQAAAAAPVAAPAEPAMEIPAADAAGFVTLEKDGYPWIFRAGAPELEKVASGGELAKHVTKVHVEAGEVKTYKSPDTETLEAYLATQPGFAARVDGEYTWIFRAGSEELARVDSGGELAKHVTKVQAVPGRGVQVWKAPDSETLQAYLASKPGFAVRVKDGYTWIFREGSKDLATVDAGGELAKHATKVQTIGGTVKTLKAPDGDIIRAYVATRPGFAARVVGDYLWIFRQGSEELATVEAGGELAKHVTKVQSTPAGVQVLKAPDSAILDAYLAQAPTS